MRARSAMTGSPPMVFPKGLSPNNRVSLWAVVA
jgi:hypothetical protein